MPILQYIGHNDSELSPKPFLMSRIQTIMAFPGEQPESASELMRAIDDQLSHIWMVRAFLKHSEEATDDQELASVHRDLYDFMLALGPSLEAGDAHRYLKLASKKFGRLRRAVELFHEIQPEVSGHTNFVMANHSLRIALRKSA